jgi:hypothetical protein
VGRLVPNGSDNYRRFQLINIVENAIFADTEFPNRLDMLPRRKQACQNLAITTWPDRLMPQLYFDPIQYPGALVRAQTA